MARWDDEEFSASGGEKSTTNNRMELEAVIQALLYIRTNGSLRERRIYLFTDSQYVKKGITEWIHRWIGNGWRTAGKKPVKNKDLWTQVHGLSGSMTVDWGWVKGHEGNELNERCDALVQAEMRCLK